MSLEVLTEYRPEDKDISAVAGFQLGAVRGAVEELTRVVVTQYLKNSGMFSSFSRVQKAQRLGSRLARQILSSGNIFGTLGFFPKKGTQS